ncbi:hypothetical protein NEMIN01_0808 [Nematocida minor]|uniref:uncharacterized protein n=1 Tax=Nematocida minor TaxID=1912983 RepID=UPI0022204E5C|nr:uncharacterized protein NEMIN01_0808 [Nematocida minor]KAI5190023.1 hypothetical protein NEMIN01_0808 [Nematocida minor]
MKRSVGYAISREAYNRHKNGDDTALCNSKLLKDGALDLKSDFVVLSCAEWDRIVGLVGCDTEIPVGSVNMNIVVNNGDVNKKFAIPAGEVLFTVIKIVLFKEGMEEEEFAREYTYSTTPEIQLGDKIVRGDSEHVKVEIFSRREKMVPQAINECTPVEFRNVGLTCYMNTALQVLLGVGELSAAIEGMSTREIDEYSRRKNTKKGYNKEKSGDLLRAYRDLIKTVRVKGDCLAKLKEIKRAMGNIDFRYRGCTEEDAGEAFSLILSNFNYLFEKTKYEKLIPDLFIYHAESVKIFKKNRESVSSEIKPLYKSFVLNGSFGSEGGPHSHVLIIHKNQLVVTRLCIHSEGRVSVRAIKERIAGSFRVDLGEIVGILVDDGKVARLADSYEFSLNKNLLLQPIFYVTDKDLDKIEFLFLSYTAAVEGLSFFTSLFSGVKNVFQMPFLVEKKCNIAQFLQNNLKIKRRTEVPNTVLDIQQNVDASDLHFGSMVIALSNKYWDATAHIDIIKNRKYEAKDYVHVQCVVSNWENVTVRSKSAGDKENFDFDTIEESTKFSRFSKYFCVQLPIGLGRPFKGEKMFDRQKLFVEKDGLMLDGVSYSLVGILVHHSFGIGGHYVAFTKRNNTWYHCNDSTITKSSVNEAISTGYPYGILYTKTDA